MFFAMTISTNEDAFFDFSPNPVPTTGQSVLRNTEIFSAIRMMKIKRFTAPIIAAL